MNILSEEELKQDPEEVFTILAKIGEGSYGSVHKAIHNRTSTVVAIKRIPIENDLDESIKEISIMNNCESVFVVAFYGSYLKDTHLWIVMEYCAAGSVSDIMNLCRTTLNEAQVAVVCQYVLQGLAYLHSKRKIHRDIKAGNILINTKGEAKLADFGVAGQLTDAMSKRNTVIGTPFWMAPEVIQEVGYGVSADIWSLGITCIEMADGRPPYHNIHPMRAIFMIPTKPPPRLENESRYSKEFKDFVARCLTKDPKERPSAETLLEDPFITQSKGLSVLSEVVAQALDAIAKGGLEGDLDGDDDTTSSDSDENAMARGLRTMKRVSASKDDSDMTIKFRKSMAISKQEQQSPIKSNASNSPSSLSPPIERQDKSDGGSYYEQESRDSDYALNFQDQSGDSYDTGTMELERAFTPQTSDHGISGSRGGNAPAIEDLKVLLAELEANMEKEIQATKLKYEIKKAPIIEAIVAKGGAVSINKPK
ncbi:Serine/threonine-protein kinase 4 [Phlyctochytrium planicorne]|nr:Serine/threonine-protein kinase 4 [Phlyctochytrium planicorne]